MSKRTGTYEWAQKVVNCVSGCEHNCAYCYARYNAVTRFKQMPVGDWPTPKVRQAEVNKRRPKYKGVVMFPSTHDITPATLDPCLEVLRKLVEADNHVLVVTKPHSACIEAICRQRNWYKHITFRFTIGGFDMLDVWEPGAPDYLERKDCLMHAYQQGWNTSISAEPLLEPWNAVALYQALVPYVTGEFWIGMLNRPDQRVDTNNPEVAEALETLLTWQTDTQVMRIVTRLDGKPHIMWKDSYQKVIDRAIAKGWIPRE